MLQAITIENFKKFLRSEIPLRPLTLLSGLNGMGKSSVIQSLLLLRQSFLSESTPSEGQPPRLVLNGELVQLGTGFDIYNRFAETQSDELGFELTFDEGLVGWRYQYSRTSNALEPLASHGHEFDIAKTSLFSDQFHYLQAERLGPRSTYLVDEYQVRERGNFGTRGEYIAHFLYYWDNTVERTWIVEDTMCHPEGVSNRLTAQVEAWMGEISPETRFDLRLLDGTDLMRLQVGFAHGEFFRATNVGFGISYTLPVIVALLASRPGGLVLLENPEAHLHPRGQVMIGELISRAAAAGVQVIVETHSDHILNGIRIAIRTDEERNFRLQANDAIFHFFQRDANGVVQIVSPTVDADGRFESQTPIHFFDEYRRSMRKLL